MKKKNKNLKAVTNSSPEVKNGLTNLVSDLSALSQLSQTDTLFKNNRYYAVSWNRYLLSQLYMEHGLIQVLIDQPVDDAFRGGIEIKSSQLDSDDLKQLYAYLGDNDIFKKLKDCVKWGRLFGGSGLVMLSNQDPKKPFNIESITKFSDLDFYAADLWELYGSNAKDDKAIKEYFAKQNFFFYHETYDPSRVATFKGKEAPSILRHQFRGWGMSEVERFIRSFNQYLKNNNVIFELLDEAKVDVYRLEDFNLSLLSNQENTIKTRIQLSNQIKNILNALVLDSKDDYEQKQVQFNGLSDMLNQIRMGIASDLRMPLTKLFGMSSAGFNTGEEDIENYNAMVEGEVRAKVSHLMIWVFRIISKKLFDIVVDDFKLEWPALRIMNSEQEQLVKNNKAERLLSFYTAGLISTEEVKQAINAGNLIDIEVNPSDELFLTPDNSPNNKFLKDL